MKRKLRFLPPFLFSPPPGGNIFPLLRRAKIFALPPAASRFGPSGVGVGVGGGTPASHNVSQPGPDVRSTWCEEAPWGFEHFFLYTEKDIFVLQDSMYDGDAVFLTEERKTPVPKCLRPLILLLT